MYTSCDDSGQQTSIVCDSVSVHLLLSEDIHDINKLIISYRKWKHNDFSIFDKNMVARYNKILGFYVAGVSEDLENFGSECDQCHSPYNDCLTRMEDMNQWVSISIENMDALTNLGEKFVDNLLLGEGLDRVEMGILDPGTLEEPQPYLYDIDDDDGSLEVGDDNEETLKCLFCLKELDPCETEKFCDQHCQFNFYRSYDPYTL